MVHSQASNTPDFNLGEFKIIPSRNLVVKEGRETSITPKMLFVLIELAKHQGQTLSKEHLFQAAWGTTITTDMVLSRAIADLRKVLGDSGQKQSFIETVSKKGYRLKTSVKWCDALEKREKSISNFRFETKVFLSSVGVLSGLFVLVFVFYYLKSQEVAHQFNNAPQLENLTSDHNQERRVRFSPDAQSIIYSKNTSKNPSQQLILHTLHNNQKIELTTPNSNRSYSDLVAVFSPTGKKVAYREFNGKECLIKIMNTLSRINELTVKCPFSTVNNLDWSPNGNYLVTTKFDTQRKQESIVLFDIKTTEFKPLSTPEFESSGFLFPRFSPNGEKIAVVFLRPTSNLWVIGLVDSYTGEFSQVLQSEQKINQVVWAGSNESLYYSLDSGMRSGIWLVDISSGSQSHILNGQMMDLDFNSTNNQFVFSQQNRETSIWKTTLLDNKQVKDELVVDSTYQNRDPVLSPDNRYLSYISTRSGIDSIWIKPLFNNNTRSVFKLKNSRLSDLAWSPNGKTVSFTLIEKKQSRIVFVNIESLEVTEFTRPNDTSKGKWSTDSNHFFWIEKDNDIWLLKRMDNRDESVITVHDKPIKRYLPVDDETIYYQEFLSNKVYSYNISSKKVAVELYSQSSYYNSWDAHNNSFYFTSWSKEENRMFLYQSIGHPRNDLALFPVNVASSAFEDNLSVSRNGRTAYYSKLTKLNYDIILMSNN